MPYSVSLSPGTLFECILACFLVAVAMTRDRFGRHVLAMARIWALRIGRHDGRLIILAALLPVVLRLLLLAIDPVPQAYDMEEFNHLLQADTYALGRLANPVHPLAVLLQSYQVVEWPHYMSGRPPLQALFLAIAVTLCRWPFAGNLLGIALTSAATCWMLLGWLPRRWAAIGCFLTIATFCLFGYWVNSFWCPTTIVLGGVLVLGLVPRVERDPRLHWAAVFLVGLALLAGTRPYENAVYAAVVCAWLAIRFLQAERRALLRGAMLHFACPVAAGGLLIILAQMGYDLATTGNARLMPYQIWRASQDLAPSFLWQPVAGHRVFDYASAAQFARWEVGVVTAITQGGLFGAVLLFGRQTLTLRDLLGPLLLLPLLCWSPVWTTARLTKKLAFLAACWTLFGLLFLSWGWPGACLKAIVVLALLLRWRNAEERLPLLLVLAGLVATSLPAFYMNVYLAAFTAPLLLLVVNGLRHLSQWSRPAGPSLAGALIFGVLFLPVAQAAGLVLGVQLTGGTQSHFDRVAASPRHEAIARLAHLPGQHVIFVRVEGDAPIVPLWLDPVWNAADVDGQRIVWLRDMRPDWTATAEHYYQGRQFWLMRMDASGQFRLSPYPSAALPRALPLTDLPKTDRDVALALGARER